MLASSVSSRRLEAIQNHLQPTAAQSNDQENSMSKRDFETMDGKKSALLIGGLTHANKEWQQMSSIVNLKVRMHG